MSKKEVDVMAMLRKHEGLRLESYKCTAGVWTIGYGHTLEVKKGMTCTLDEAEHWLRSDVMDVVADLTRFLPWWTSLSNNRKAVMIDMCFNLGIFKLLKFKRTLEYIKDGEYYLASQAMLESKWAKQVGKRAITLSELMKHG